MNKNEYIKMFDAENNYWWYTTLHQLVISIIKRTKNKDKIIDAGCGTCRLLELLKINGLEASGFDISDTAIKLCKKRNFNNINKQDITNWYTDEKFDIIISLDVLCSIPQNKISETLKLIHNNLKDNGLLILNLPAFKFLNRNHDLAVNIQKRFTKKNIKKNLYDAGFTYIYASYRMLLLFFAIPLKKFFEKKQTPVSDLTPVPKFINKLLKLYGKTENFFILNKIPIPFGSSIFVIAKK